jgi:hypothetical protein
MEVNGSNHAKDRKSDSDAKPKDTNGKTPATSDKASASASTTASTTSTTTTATETQHKSSPRKRRKVNHGMLCSYSADQNNFPNSLDYHDPGRTHVVS